MRIFITGKNGFIAKNIFNRLARENTHIIETLNKGENVQYKLNTFKPDIIFHLAVESVDKDKMVDSNILLTHTLLEYCRFNPIQRIFIFGSSSEYGRKNKPIVETDALDPTTIYEGTKAAASMLAQSYSYTYKIPMTVIRPMSVYGPYEKVSKFMTRLFLNRVEAVNHAFHDWIYIDDFVDAVICILNYPNPPLFDKVNIGLGVQRSNEDVVNIARSILKRPIEYKLVDTHFGCGVDSETWVCDTTHLRTMYGFTPSISLEEGMQKHYEWFKNSLIRSQT